MTTETEILRSLIFSPLMRSDEVARYSGTRLSSTETLGQHITDMSMMCYLMANKLTHLGETVDIGVLLEKCLIHDIDEISTGDLPRNTKYAMPEIKQYMDEVAELAVERYADMYDMPYLLDKWRHAKEGKEGLIVKVCDMLCVVRKAAIEVEVENNMSALRVTKELIRHIGDMINTIDPEDYGFTSNEAKFYVKNILISAHDIIDEINIKYDEIAEKYNITKNIIEERID